jgi:hypothetical protein
MPTPFGGRAPGAIHPGQVGRPHNFKPGQIIKFTYDHQTVDKDTDGRYKEVFVLNPWWGNKLHGLDLKRLNLAEREVLEAIMDPDRKDEVHKLPIVNDIKRRMDPLELVKNPMLFYTKFVKPFMRGKDVYRTYVPRRMVPGTITIVSDPDLKTGRPKNNNPLFGPKEKPAAPEKPPQTPIDKMKAAADLKKRRSLFFGRGPKKGQPKKVMPLMPKVTKAPRPK